MTRRLCFTGPESTGKTTLAHRLAAHLGVECVPEASRLYAERVGRELTVSDVEPIACEEIALVDAATERAARNGAQALVLDTDLVSTIVYAERYYGYESAWLDAAARTRLADLYFLCDIDTPWVPDGIRDRPGDRVGMRDAFVRHLERLGATVVRLTGDWDARWEAVRVFA